MDSDIQTRRLCASVPHRPPNRMLTVGCLLSLTLALPVASADSDLSMRSSFPTAANPAWTPLPRAAVPAEEAWLVDQGWDAPTLWTEEGHYELGRHNNVRLVSALGSAETLGPAPLPGSGDAGTSGGIGDAEALGSEPEDYSFQFLRQQTVLLRPGEWQFDLGIVYSLAEDKPWVTAGGNIARGRVRQRLLLVPLELRYGLTRRLQIFASAPVGWSNTEVSSTGLLASGYDEYANTGGIGDVRAGVTMLLREASGNRPNLVATFAFTAPTGDSSFPLAGLSPESRLGEGFWAASGSFLVIHTYDPVIVYYGLGARFRFEEEFPGNQMISPGGQYLYQLGVGFAVNDRVTLSTSFLGAYIPEFRVNGQRLQGSIQEPMRLRFSATIARSCKIVEPFAEIGMTDDASAASVGIIWTY